MAKKYTYYIIVVLLAFSSVSCSKFLETPVTNRIAIDEIFTDFEGARTTMVGCYDNLRSYDYYMRDFYTYPDLTGGNIRYSKTRNPVLNNNYNFTNSNSTDFNDMAAFYKTAYATIYSINTVIKYVNKIPNITIQQRNRFLADAYALRALIHFDLVRVFAQPYNFTTDASHTGIVIKNVNAEVGEPSPNPSSVKQVYDQIVADFDSSIVFYGNSVPIYTAGNAKTWLSIDAAKAFLSKVCLYKGDWNRALQLATALIDSKVYPLVSNAQYASSWSKKNISTESIFEIAYGTNVGGSLGDFFNPTISGSNYIQFATTSDLLSMYDKNDIRMDITMFKDTVFDNRPASFSKKYYGTNDSANNIKVIRSSELYLIAAEAAAELGNLDEGANYLNTIRKRANPTAITFTATSKDALIDEVLNERRRELCFEGNLFFDIARRKKNLVRIDCTSENASFNYPNPKYACTIPKNQ